MASRFAPDGLSVSCPTAPMAARLPSTSRQVTNPVNLVLENPSGSLSAWRVMFPCGFCPAGPEVASAAAETALVKK